MINKKTIALRQKSKASLFPIVVDQKFIRCRLNELLDFGSLVVEEYTKGRSVIELADSIIRHVRYPFHMGSPDDTHIYDCFHGDFRWHRRIDSDYWQHASETLSYLVGDCEDSSIAFVTALHALGIWNVYEIFGVVRDADTQEILGGHAWSAFWHDGVYRLYESTLDEPPAEYPAVYGTDLSTLMRPLRFHNTIYDPDHVWNYHEFHQVSKLGLGRQLGGNIDKFRAIERAWNAPTKVTKEWEKLLNKLMRLLAIIHRR